MYAVRAGPKATPDEVRTLKQLVYAVRLENTRRYDTEAPVPEAPVPEAPVPEALVLTHTPARPSVQTLVGYSDIFDAVLDPAFNEDEFMGSPPLPLGDHCTP